MTDPLRSNPVSDLEPRTLAAAAISNVLDLAQLPGADLAILLAVIIREAIAHRCPTATEAIKLTTMLSASLAADLRGRLDADRAVATAQAEPASLVPN